MFAASKRSSTCVSIGSMGKVVWLAQQRRLAVDQVSSNIRPCCGVVHVPQPPCAGCEAQHAEHGGTLLCACPLDRRGSDMLERLKLENVGPSSAMTLELAPRLNLITGDNGLGKSFLLDIAWWALTRKWPRELNPRLTAGYMARPKDVELPARLGITVKTKTGRSMTYKSEFSSLDEAWPGRPGRPWNPGLVVHAHADGGFSVWDPARNYWNRIGNVDVQERASGLCLFPGGGLVRVGRPRQVDPRVQGTSGRLVQLDPGARRQRGTHVVGRRCLDRRRRAVGSRTDIAAFRGRRSGRAVDQSGHQPGGPQRQR